MGKYINIGNDGFRKARNDEYIDKSELIGFVNRALNTEHNMLCLTRARRFGKSMAAKMLCAYYDQSCDSRELFDDLKIAQDTTYIQHCNHYPVIYLDITYFTTSCYNMSDIVSVMEKSLIADLQQTYPNVPVSKDEPLIDGLLRVAESQKQKFIMIVDEWDAICRESDSHPQAMRQYVDWLRNLYKTPMTDRVFAGVYMTGILPIVQYDTQSALNNFEELTMISPGALAGHFGFVDDEVQYLCDKYHMDMTEMKHWYDGYQMGEKVGVYNPYSVISAIRKRSLESYWATTSAYESLKKYIQLNYDGLKDAVVAMLTGERVGVNVLRFTNDLHKIKSCDDALTTLIHLGYLSYDRATRTCGIPNFEVKQEFEKSIRDTDWTEVVGALSRSEMLVQRTIEGDADFVAYAVEQVHDQCTSILRYNDENSLRMTLMLAFYMVQNDYAIFQELPAGKGFADIVLLPKKGADRPAMVLELKWNKSADSAIRQIKEKRYAGVLTDFSDEVLLVGINYSKNSKKHECVIETLGDIVPSLSQACPKSVPSLSQVLNGMDWDVVKVILEHVNHPVGIDVLMQKTNQTNRSRFRNQFIKPLLLEGYIAMTQPDKPTSSKQQYYSTEKGRELLRSSQN